MKKIYISIALVYICGWFGGYYAGKHFADRWYAKHPQMIGYASAPLSTITSGDHWTYDVKRHTAIPATVVSVDTECVVTYSDGSTELKPCSIADISVLGPVKK